MLLFHLLALFESIKVYQDLFKANEYRLCTVGIYFVGDFPSAASIYQNRESVQWGSPGPSEADQPEGQLHGTPRAR